MSRLIYWGHKLCCNANFVTSFVRGFNYVSLDILGGWRICFYVVDDYLDDITIEPIDFDSKYSTVIVKRVNLIEKSLKSYLGDISTPFIRMLPDNTLLMPR
ncbi:TPA: hypothetical protein I7730_00515 [Vibrio vulnificus]|uniref:Uncharacterized protein n=1 Tax=Vibrio vulnificus TaxID=672 RepID=A0A8H9K5J0_VIBVL|nr:hypothetical protein [Vibrio vulnificus]